MSAHSLKWQVEFIKLTQDGKFKLSFKDKLNYI